MNIYSFAANPSELPMPPRPSLTVLLLVLSFDLGGTERQFVELARGLQRRGHKVTFAAFYKKGALLPEVEQAGINVIDLGKVGRSNLVTFIRRTRRAIRSVGPDVIYTFLGGANIVAAALRPFVSKVPLVWSIRRSHLDSTEYGWLPRVAYALEDMLARVPELIVANSSAGREFAAARGFPKARIEVVPNGIDVQRFRPDADLRRMQRRRWRLADNEIAIGVLARLDPLKGHSTFLRAAALLASERDLRFLCIGDGPLESGLKESVADLGLGKSVLFTGREDPVAALNALDIACSPSQTEGFSNAIAEAMACEVPCVVSDVGDSRLIVGETGFVVPREDPEALAAALLGMVRERSKRGSPARRRIVDNFSVEKMIERTEALLVPLSRAVKVTSSAGPSGPG